MKNTFYLDLFIIFIVFIMKRGRVGLSHLKGIIRDWSLIKGS